MKIRKFQVGGTVTQMPTYVPTPEVVNDQYTQPTLENGNRETKSKIPELIPKELLKSFAEKGLPTDVDATISVLMQLQSKYSNDYEISPEEMQQDYLQIISMVNKVSFNQQKWNDISKQLQQNNSFGEIAMTKQGYAVGQTSDGKIKIVTPQEIFRNRSNIRLLTNSELLNLRSRNNQFAFDHEMFEQLEQNVSPDKIQSWIYDIIGKAGNTESNLTSEMYFQMDSDGSMKALRGMIQLLQDPAVVQQALGVISPYQKVTKNQQSNALQLKSQLNLMASLLPENYRKYLTLKAAQAGLDPKTGISQMLVDIFNGSLKTKEELKFEPLKDPNGDISGSGEFSSGKDKDNTKWVDADLGTQILGREKGITTIFKNKDSVGLQVVGIKSGYIPTADGKSNVSSGTSWNVFKEKSIITPMSSISQAVILSTDDEGNTIPLSIRGFEQHMTLGSSNYAIVELPTMGGQLDVDKISESEDAIKEFQKNRDTLVEESDGTWKFKEGKEDKFMSYLKKEFGIDYLVLDKVTGQLSFDPKICQKFITVDANIGLQDKGFWSSPFYNNFGDLENATKFMEFNETMNEGKNLKIYAKKLHGEDTNVKYDKVGSTVVYIPFNEQTGTMYVQAVQGKNIAVTPQTTTSDRIYHQLGLNDPDRPSLSQQVESMRRQPLDLSSGSINNL